MLGCNVLFLLLAASFRFISRQKFPLVTVSNEGTKCVVLSFVTLGSCELTESFPVVCVRASPWSEG